MADETKDKSGEQANNTTSTDTPPADKTETVQAATYTPEQQAHIDKIIGERLAKAREKWEADNEQAKQKADKEAEEKRLADQAEWQKLAETRAAEVAAARAERDKLQADLVDTRIRHAVEIEAARLEFNDPQDAYDLIDVTGFEIDDEGQVNGVKQALEALVKEKPYLIKAGKSTGVGTPGKFKFNPQAIKDDQVQERTMRQSFPRI